MLQLHRLEDTPLTRRRILQLSQLKVGQSASVTRLLDGGTKSNADSDVLGRRLMELGFIPGTIVTCMHEAPLTHDPRCFMVRGMHVALRSYEADRIEVSVPVAPVAKNETGEQPK